MSSTEIEQTAVLVEQLAQLCMNADNADVTFTVKGQHLPAHRIILATRSEYFRALLFGALKESKQNEITLHVSVDAFKYLMKYIYTGSLSLKQMKIRDILDTLELAHQYGFIDLQKALANYLGKVIGMSNVCVILETARLLDLTELSSTCYTFMDENANSIIQSYNFRRISYEALFGLLQRDTFAADEFDIFNAVRDWYLYNADKPSKAMQTNRAEKLYNLVRFTLMSQHELLNVVRSANVLSPNRLLDILAEKEKLTVLPYRAVSCLPELIIDWNKIKWSNSSSGSCSRHGEIDLGNYFKVNGIQVDRRRKGRKFYHQTNYTVRVSVDKERWTKGVTCEAHSPYLTVAHFEISIVRYIRIQHVKDVSEVGVIKAIFYKPNCGCKTGEQSGKM